MKLGFEDIIDKHKDKPGLVIGHGPSLNNYVDKLTSLKGQGFILFGCNNWYYFHEKPNYWVLATNDTVIEKNTDRMGKYDIPVFYSHISDKSNVKDLYCDYLPYHQYPRDVYNHSSEASIQERVKKYTKNDSRYGVGVCVGLHMIAFSILMGCNPIYLIGIDIDYILGFAKNKDPESTIDYMRKNYPETFKKDFQYNVKSDLIVLNDSAKNAGIEIINLNQNSCYDTFEIGKLE